MNQRTFNVRGYGATGEGQNPDSAAILRAIQACFAAGGGRVVFPPGTYLSGPIELKSGVELHLEAGATVLFSRDFDAYPLCLTNFEGQQTVRCRSPLWGEGLRDVTLSGAGTFDGRGQAWRPVEKRKLTASEWAAWVASGGVVDEENGVWWPTRGAMEGKALVQRLRSSGKTPNLEDFRAGRDFLRPNMVQLTNCQNVAFEGLTFRNSPCWNIHLLMCEAVTLRHLTVTNPWHAENGDGLDIESCREVEISDCLIDVGDDGICLKSGKDEEGRDRARPCEKISVRDCTVLHGHGGLTIGSEMSGGVRDVEVSNCTFRGTEVGIRFKTARGRGGLVENIDIRDISMSGIAGAAISFDMFYAGTAWGETACGETAPNEPKWEAVSDATPQIRSVRLENIRCDGAKLALEIRGLPEMPIEDISLKNITIRAEQGIVIKEARGVTLREVYIETPQIPAVQCHHVSNLHLEGVEVGARPQHANTLQMALHEPSSWATGQTQAPLSPGIGSKSP